MLPRLTCGAEGVHHLRLSCVVVGDQSELSLGVFLLYLHDVLAQGVTQLMITVLELLRKGDVR